MQVTRQGAIVVLRRRERPLPGRHRQDHVRDVPAAAPEPQPRCTVVDDARARLDPATRPLLLPLPAARPQPPDRRLIRTG